MSPTHITHCVVCETEVGCCDDVHGGCAGPAVSAPDRGEAPKLFSDRPIAGPPFNGLTPREYEAQRLPFDPANPVDMQMLTVLDCADHLALAARDGRTDLVSGYAETLHKATRHLRHLVRFAPPDSVRDTAGPAEQPHEAWTDTLIRDYRECCDAVGALTMNVRIARASEERVKMSAYAWLGYWRDKMPPEAVMALQDILGPVPGGSPTQEREHGT